ncbi:MAG: hypothetical protein AB7K37_08900 [Cyclobacteriaceae bacterium]
MSHTGNVVSYSRLVAICTGQGGRYKPGNGNLQLTAMRALLEKAQSSLQDVSLKKNALDSVVNERAHAFADLAVLANRVVGTMVSNQLPAATIDDARFYTRLIGGKRATPRAPLAAVDAEGKPLVVRSFTQLSFVAKADHFFRLAQMVGELPGYVTHEAELQPKALMKKAEQLQQLNEAVHQAMLALDLARVHRNRTLYKGKDSVSAIVSAAKRYVKVAFGTLSSEAAQLASLSFTKMYVR